MASLLAWSQLAKGNVVPHLTTAGKRNLSSLAALDLNAIAAKFGNETLNVGTTTSEPKQYDLIVIGGGSGGLACAKEAARHGASVALFDYVAPSPQGSTWGLGGTCVNVGCIPKKLMHHASNIGANLRDARQFGWELENLNEVDLPNHSWEKLVQAVQDHIKSLNFGYAVSLGTPVSLSSGNPNPVEYHNAKAWLSDKPGQVEFQNSLFGSQPETSYAMAKNIVLAVGGRPSFPSIPGAKSLGISSDDLFSLPRNPGKTLIVGGSYVALECAGALSGLGLDVTIAIRSRALKGDGFDEQSVNKVLETMQAFGTSILHGFAPVALSKQDGQERIQVDFTSSTDKSEEMYSEEFDTVMFATGRDADIETLNLFEAGVNIKNGKVQIGSKNHQQHSTSGDILLEFETSASGVYCIGDAADTGAPELTPVAIRQGEILARKLFGKSSLNNSRNWTRAISESLMIPSTVFTPVEYGRVGLSEEAAREQFGYENVEAYLMEWQSLEIAAAHRRVKHRNGNEHEFPLGCFSKLVCLKTDNERVVGFHYVGPHAGEVLQGTSMAICMGATKSDFETASLGIHPTDAESMVDMSVSRSSGEDWVISGGCGGGKCG